MKKGGFINWSIFVLLSFIWGSSFIVMKYSKDELSAVHIAALRIFSAGLVFLPFGIFHISRIPLKKLGWVFATGILGNLLPAFLFAEAIANNIDSSLAAILNSLTPLCVVVAGLTFFRIRIKKQKLWGVIIGFFGLCLLFAVKGIYFTNLKYGLMVFLATLLYGFNVNIVSKYLHELNPIHTATVSIGFLAFPTALILWQQQFLAVDFQDEHLMLAVIASVMLGIVGSAIATALFYILVKRAGGIFASLVTYGIPFVAIFWGLIYGEVITVLQMGCLAIILLGVYMANKN